ncbi:MAG TPA: hypothetical protein ENK18_19860 [Deltaproteobacteria bacterium]|nr:hypothetical protein [Deltaproteobacteria bacterium]
MRGALPLIWLLGCSEEPIETPAPILPPCHSDTLSIDAAPSRGAFGDLLGGSLWCGNPPQGGAPYSPLRLRLEGSSGWSAGMFLELIATDLADGTELAYTALEMGLVCANVGESEGSWVGSEAHMRYDGRTLDDLEGRTAELTVRAAALEGDEQVEASWWVDLVLDPP